MTDLIRERTREYFGFGTKRMKELKVCGICKTAVSAHRLLCTKCHARLPGKTLYDIYKSHHRACAGCGIILPHNAAYCPQCGEKQATPPNRFETADARIAM